MARIVVITPNDRCCMGARQLSSLVKGRHDFTLLCYGEYHHEGCGDTARPGMPVDERLLLDFLRSRQPDLVGFSYRSIQKDLAAHLAGRIRREVNLPVLMGGIGATSEPDAAMRSADLACVGEGDFALPRLLDAIDRHASLDAAVRDVPNLWIRTEAGIVRTPMERLVSAEELSELPFIDYDARTTVSIVNGTLTENDGRFDNEVGAYPMLTSRGCPFACSFCHNSNVHDLYRGQRYCRQRSVESVIREMEAARAMPATRMFSIYDDLFTFHREWVLEFAALYKERVRLPFWCYTHPAAVNAEPMRALVDAGLNNAVIGLQSGSERTLYEVFNRRTPRRKILDAAEVLRGLKCNVQVDLITANPFETDDDRRDTLELLLVMPKNTRMTDPGVAWRYSQSRLTFFPNSRITRMVEERGIDPAFDPDTASFWEMLYELTLLDHLPESSVMYLSYLFDEFRASAPDFRVETGAAWLVERVLDRPIEDVRRFEGRVPGWDSTERVLGWMPTCEELTAFQVRVLMDGLAVLDAGEGEPMRDARLALVTAAVGSLAPERRASQLKEYARSRVAGVGRLAEDIGRRAAERIELWKEVEARGRWGLERDRTVQERDATIRRLQAEIQASTPRAWTPQMPWTGPGGGPPGGAPWTTPTRGEPVGVRGARGPGKA